MLNPANFTSTALPTAQNVRDLVNMNVSSVTGGAVITGYVIELYQDDTVTVYNIPATGGNDVSSYLLNASISLTGKADIQRECTVTFDGALASQFPTLTGTLTLVMKISRAYYDNHDNQILKVPRGFFRFDIPDQEITTDAGDSILTVKGYDLSRDLQRIFPLHPVVMPAGLDIGAAITALLRGDNRTPAEGGRSPAGTPVPGTPRDGLPGTVTSPYLAAPTAPTVTTATTGGTVAAGTYQAKITYVNAQGETTASSSSSVTASVATSTISVASPPASGGGGMAATGYYVYLTQAGGSTFTRQQAAGSPTAIGTQYTLTAPPTSTGAAPPTANTAGSAAPPYTSNGQSVSSFPLDNTTGYLKSPSGTYGNVYYSPYGGARCDSTSYAPIDPWTGLAMPLVTGTSGTGMLWQSGKPNLVYSSAQGQFFFLGSTPATSVNVADPFKMTSLPAGYAYNRPDPATPPSGVLGTLKPPLVTWPYDYDGSGPYYQTSQAATVTSTGATSGKLVSLDTTPPNPIAQTNGVGSFTLLPAGDYLLQAGTSAANPAFPGATTVTAVPYSETGYIGGPSISGWSFAPQTWTMALFMSAVGYVTGSISMTAEVFEQNGGTYKQIGTLASGYSAPWDGSAITQMGGAGCGGPVGAYTAASGSSLAYRIKLTVASPGLIANIPAGTNTATTASLQPVTLRIIWQNATTVPSGQAYTNTNSTALGTTQPGAPVTPTNSGSGVTWPDSNYPALAPSGCVCFYANIPANRISLPASTRPLLVSNTWDKQTSLYAKIQELCEMAGWNPLGIDEYGVFTTEQQDYWTSSTLPAIEWTFSNSTYQTDGLLVSPVTLRQLDQQNMANVIEVEAQSNSQGQGIVSIQVNNAAASPISFPNLNRREIRIIKADHLNTQIQVDDLALEELLAAAQGAQAVEIQVPLNPFFSRRNHVNVQFTTDSGVVMIDGGSNPFVVDTWTEDSHNPVQRIVCGRSIALGGTLPAATDLTRTLGIPLGVI